MMGGTVPEAGRCAERKYLGHRSSILAKVFEFQFYLLKLKKVDGTVLHSCVIYIYSARA